MGDLNVRLKIARVVHDGWLDDDADRVNQAATTCARAHIAGCEMVQIARSGQLKVIRLVVVAANDVVGEGSTLF